MSENRFQKSYQSCLYNVIRFPPLLERSKIYLENTPQWHNGYLHRDMLLYFGMIYLLLMYQHLLKLKYLDNNERRISNLMSQALHIPTKKETSD